MKYLITIFILLLASLGIHGAKVPQQVPGDDHTGSSSGYHNTELNSAGPDIDFAGNIERTERLKRQKKKNQASSKKPKKAKVVR